MGNHQSLSKCLICQVPNNDTFCSKCELTLQHIKDQPNLEIENTQLLLNILNVTEYELIENIGNSQCKECKWKPKYILYNCMCQQCAINAKLKKIEEISGIKIVKVSGTHKFNIEKVKFNDRRTFFRELFASSVTSL
jgi:hypothetical protein